MTRNASAAIRRHWREEMAANNAIEGNPLDAADWEVGKELDRRGLTGRDAVAFIVDAVRRSKPGRLDAAE